MIERPGGIRRLFPTVASACPTFQLSDPAIEACALALSE